MYVVSVLAMAVQEQAATTAASVAGDDGRMYLWAAMVIGVLALLAALLLARAVIASDTGTSEMQAISNAIREGAEAFLRRQYRTIGAIAAVLAVVRVYRIQPVAQNGTVCDEDGDQLPGGCGVLRRSRDIRECIARSGRISGRLPRHERA